ncbi:MAG TPA: HAD family hydrolase [Thermoplasmata archaeon]|nr:HAD family hydrolase [Thermoplasmata archaeon]
MAIRSRVCPAAILVDDWNTLRRASEPGALRTHLADAMKEEGLLTDEELFLDAFDYAAAFHRSMTERDLREHTIEQVLSLAMYTLGEPVPPTAPALRRAATVALERNAAQVRWYDDAPPFLESLTARKVPIALVTNTIFGLGRLWEERLAKFFPTRVLSREFGFVKPHPGIFLEAAKALRVDPREALFIGDLLLSDVWGAQRVGMTAVLVDRGIQPQAAFHASDERLASHLGVDLAAVKPEATVTSLDEVLALLA